MRHFRFALSSLWFYAVMVFGILICSDLGFLTSSPLSSMPMNSYYIFTGLFCLVLIAYFVCEHRKNKMPIDWILAPVVIGLLVCNLIAIWATPEVAILENPENGAIVEVYVDKIGQVKDTIFACVSYASLYVVAFVFARGKLKSRKLVWLALSVVLVNMVFCVISVFLDKEFFIRLINGTELNSIPGCKSLYINENSFGESLLVALICSMVVIYQRPKWFWVWLLLLVDFAFIFFTTSATCILVATIAIVVFAVVEIVFGYIYKHPIKTTIYTVIFTLLILGIILTLAIGTNKNVPAIVAIDEFVRKEILGKDFGTYTGRKEIWKHCWDLINVSPFRLWFGFGMNLSNEFLGAFEASYNPIDFSSYPHNGFIKILIDGGLIALIPYVLLLVYYLYCLIRLTIKKHVHFSLVYLLLASTVIMHGFFESSHFFKNNALCAIETILVLMPPIIGWKQIRHPKLRDSIIGTYAIPTQGISSKHFIMLISTVIIGLISAGIASFAGPIIYNHNLIMKCALLGIAFLVISLIFVPFLVFTWYKKATDRRFFIRILINSILILGIPVLVGYLLHTYVTSSRVIIALSALGVYAALLFVDMLVYALIRRISLSTWIKETFKSIFVYNFCGKIVGIILSAMTMLVIQLFMPNLDNMSLIIAAVACFFVYLISYLLIPSQSKSEMIEDLNEESILGLKRLILEDRV